MDNTPLVSILMNCHNGEKYLHAAIDSVISQSYQNWEIIFLDNESTDDSLSIAKSYNDSRIFCHSTSKYIELYEARNIAISKSKGEFIAFLDVDDWWFSDKLKRQIPLFSDPKVGLVHSNYQITNGFGNKVSSRKRLPEGSVTNHLLDNYYIGFLTVVIRRSVFEDGSPPFDTRYHIIGDFDLVLRISIKWFFSCVQDALACYRLHGENETILKEGRYVEDLSRWLQNNEALYVSLGCKGFEKQKQTAWYLKGIYLINGKKYKLLFLHLFSLSLSLKTIKLLIILIFPKKILKYFKLSY